MTRPDEEDAELSAIARELRGRVGEEFRAEAEESERDAAKAVRRARSLADVVRHLHARGDGVLVGALDRTFRGIVTAAADDFVSLATGSGRVDLRLGAVTWLRVAASTPSGGREAVGGVSSFKARLLEIELEGGTVEVGAHGLDDPVVGVLHAVALDHVVVRDLDGEEWFVPTAALVYLRQRADLMRG